MLTRAFERIRKGKRQILDFWGQNFWLAFKIVALFDATLSRRGRSIWTQNTILICCIGKVVNYGTQWRFCIGQLLTLQETWKSHTIICWNELIWRFGGNICILRRSQSKRRGLEVQRIFSKFPQILPWLEGHVFSSVLVTCLGRRSIVNSVELLRYVRVSYLSYRNNIFLIIPFDVFRSKRFKRRNRFSHILSLFLIWAEYLIGIVATNL